MIKKYWILTLVLTLICHNAYSKNDIFITASVNGEILTNLDVYQEIEYLKILNPELNELNNKKIFNIAKKSLINEKIKKKELEKFFVFDEEVPLINQIFEDFYKNLGFSNEKEFENILFQKKTFSIIQIKKKMKIELFWNRIILNKYDNQIKINENELMEKIKKINEYKLEYLLSEIFFNKEKNLNLNEQINKIEQSISDVGFNNTASIFSKSESANFGGKIGWIKEENLSKKIIAELKKIKKGEYSSAIQFGNNFLILKIEDKKIKKIETNKKLILKKMTEFEKNKQLNQFSNIYFNKIKVNYVINEK